MVALAREGKSAPEFSQKLQGEICGFPNDWTDPIELQKNLRNPININIKPVET